MELKVLLIKNIKTIKKIKMTSYASRPFMSRDS